MAVIPQDVIQGLLGHTNSLMNHIYHFQMDFEHPPGSTRRGACINFQDISEQRSDFLRELKVTACNWVYSRTKYQKLMEAELQRRDQDHQAAAAQIQYLVDRKFRKSQPQGQFGELLLFNFIQHFFSAPPLLRKMPITTNPGMERNGADAIHYAPNGDQHVFFLGEAKAYTSKYNFATAFSASLTSVCETFHNYSKELDLYVYDDFIEEPLLAIAESLKRGELLNVRYELVCIIAYHETNPQTGNLEHELKDCVKKIVSQRYTDVDAALFDGIPPQIVSRLHYIVLPIWDFDTLLEDF